MTDEIKAAEQRGYSKGYVAGRRKRNQGISSAQLRAQKQAFLDRVFIAILPSAMLAQGWKFGDEPITTTQDRVLLAREWANEALLKRPIA